MSSHPSGPKIRVHAVRIRLLRLGSGRKEYSVPGPRAPLALFADLQTGYVGRLGVRPRTGTGLACCRSHCLFLGEIRKVEQGKWGWGEVGWGGSFRREAEEAKLYMTQ